MIVRIIYRPSYARAELAREVFDVRGLVFDKDQAPRKSKRISRQIPRSQRVVLRSLALALVRLSFAGLAMAAWRIASDLGLPVPFVIKDGVFSHWQVWFGASVLLAGGAGLLARRLQFGRAQDDAESGREQAA